jgi:hypothetical protein
LTAARDEGRALPVPQADLDKRIADYRGRAAELLAYRQKTDTKAPATDVDAEIAKVRSGAMQFLPADTTKLGVEHMKKLHSQRLAFCQLTRDWYEVQNGLRTATPAAEQQKLTRQHDEAMRQIAANAPKPPVAQTPMPPALKPSVVQPIARAPAPSGPAAQPIPTAKVAVPAAGAPAGGTNPKDTTVGSDVTHGEFAGRPLWSALAECSGRMDLIQTRGGGSTRVQSEGYARRAAYILWGSRGDVGGNDLPAMAGPVAQERSRLGPRIAASWDEYRQRTGQPPFAAWGQVCHSLEQYASNEANRILQAKRAQAQRDHAEAMKRFNETSSSSSSSSSGGGYSSSGGNSSLDAAAAASRAEHQRNMETFKRDTQKIRNEIKAIDRKYR